MMMKNNGGKLTAKIQTESDTFLSSQKVSCLMCWQFDVKRNVSFLCVCVTKCYRQEVNDDEEQLWKINKETTKGVRNTPTIKSELHVLYAFDINRNGVLRNV